MLCLDISVIAIITVKSIYYRCIIHEKIDEKHYKDLIIYFTRCDLVKSIRSFSLYYYELMEKIEEHKGKKIFDS